MTCVALLLAATSVPAWAQEATPPDLATSSKGAESEMVIDPSQIKRPQDFAPPEQIVAGRDLTSFRKPGTLLAGTTREIPKVDEADLLERKYAIYSGERFYRGPTRGAEASDRSGLARHGTTAGTVEPPRGSALGWFGWGLMTAIVASVLVAWRKGWFVPFSVRAQETRASQAASSKPRSRAAEGLRHAFHIRKPGA